jgi:hypothetical protein
MTQAPALSAAPNLRTGFPRSPNTLVGDYVLLGRILDKCRAVLAGTNGEYKFNCPLDQRFFVFTGIDAQIFQAQVASGQTDAEMSAWVIANSQVTDRDTILAWNYTQRWAGPDTPDRMAYFETLRQEVAPDKPYLQSWFQLLDAEEGRY